MCLKSWRTEELQDARVKAQAAQNSLGPWDDDEIVPFHQVLRWSKDGRKLAVATCGWCSILSFSDSFS